MDAVLLVFFFLQVIDPGEFGNAYTEDNRNDPRKDEKVTARCDFGIRLRLTNPVKLDESPSSKAKIVNHGRPLGKSKIYSEHIRSNLPICQIVIADTYSYSHSKGILRE